MAERVQRLYIGDEPEASIGDLVNLSTEQLNALTQFLDAHGFFGGEAKDVLILAGEIGLSFERTVDLLRLTGNMEGERARLELTPDDLLVEFDTYLERHNEPELRSRLRAISAALKNLFSDRPKIALRAKVATVTSGIVPQAIDFYSLCDLRPVFNEERDKALEYVPVALIRVLVRSDIQEANSSLIFQLDRSGVSKLEEFLDKLRKKMTFLEGVRKELLERKN